MQTEGSREMGSAGSSSFGVNDARTGADRDTGLTQRRSGPVRYELVSYRGEIFGPYPTAQAAAEAAKIKWPHQHQDEDRVGLGWDVQVVGLRDPELPTD